MEPQQDTTERKASVSASIPTPPVPSQAGASTVPSAVHSKSDAPAQKIEDASKAQKDFEAKVDELETLLRNKAESLSGKYDDKVAASRKLESTFKYFDTDGSGVIDYPEFIAAMVRLNIFVGGRQREIDALFDRFDENGDGTLDYKEFASRLFGLGDHVLLDGAGKSVIERIKSKILENRGGNGVRALTTLLRRMDSNKNNKLERDELIEGFARLKVNVNEDEVDKIMHYFDVDDDQHISINEFIRGIRGVMNKPRKNIVREAFRRLDKTGDGIVSIEDLVQAYDVSQHPSVIAGIIKAEEALQDLLNVYDSARSKDGMVTWPEFCEYYRDLSASIEHDGEFELMVRNAWHISGGEGECANTSNLRVLVTHSDGSQEVVEVKDDLGLSTKDMKKIEEKLASQGVSDIARVTTAA